MRDVQRRRAILGLIGSLILMGQAAPSSGGGRALHVALHDGFNGQTVSVAVDGHEVYRRIGVRTDIRISRADAFDTAAPDHVIMLSITVEPGGQHAKLQVDPRATPYVAVDLKAGEIAIRPSHDPFFYM
jgi:hypothetical protein